LGSSCEVLVLAGVDLARTEGVALDFSAGGSDSDLTADGSAVAATLEDARGLEVSAFGGSIGERALFNACDSGCSVLTLVGSASRGLDEALRGTGSVLAGSAVSGDREDEIGGLALVMERGPSIAGGLAGLDASVLGAGDSAVAV
jgi:hypothetical protein